MAIEELDRSFALRTLLGKVCRRRQSPINVARAAKAAIHVFLAAACQVSGPHWVGDIAYVSTREGWMYSANRGDARVEIGTVDVQDFWGKLS